MRSVIYFTTYVSFSTLDSLLLWRFNLVNQFALQINTSIRKQIIAQDYNAYAPTNTYTARPRTRRRPFPCHYHKLQ